MLTHLVTQHLKKCDLETLRMLLLECHDTRIEPVVPGHVNLHFKNSAIAESSRSTNQVLQLTSRQH